MSYTPQNWVNKQTGAGATPLSAGRLNYMENGIAAAASAADAAIPAAQKGVPNGVAPLDINGLVPASMLASTGGTVTNVTYDVQSFTTGGSYTWTKPTGATGAVWVTLIGAGGGGGGGQNWATNSGFPGGGGAGGNREEYKFKVSDLASTVAVTVGTGGAPGTGGVAGANGGAGTVTTFGSCYVTGGGGGGGAVSTIGVAGAATSPATYLGGAGGSGATGSRGAGGAPGGASGIPYGTTGNAYSGAAPMGYNPPTLPVGGASVSNGGVAGTGGAGVAINGGPLATSGAGGGGSSASPGTGGAGGAGMFGSGGGGGGGGYSAGGPGGKGGDGLVLVITECVNTTVTSTAPAVVAQSSVGVANGVASLDSNGLLITSQLPYPTAFLPADFPVTYGAGAVDVMSITLPSVGYWNVVVDGTTYMNTTASTTYQVQAQFATASGLVVAATGATAGSSGYLYIDYSSTGTVRSHAVALWNGTGNTLAAATGGYRGFRMFVTLNVTSAGVLKLQGLGAGGSYAQAIGLGTVMRATKVS